MSDLGSQYLLRDFVIHVAETTHEWAIPCAVTLCVYFLLRYFFVTQWDDVLYRACKEGDLLNVQKALRKRANLETKKAPRELTPLMLATLQNNLAIVSLLLAAGAKTEARDEEGRTSLMLAAQKGHVDCVHALLAKGADPTAKSFDGWTVRHSLAHETRELCC